MTRRWTRSRKCPPRRGAKAGLREIIAERKITFDPGSTSISADAVGILDDIAEVLRGCGRMSMEVAGHTDSQGRLETNMRLSQQRAEAVVAGLMARGALVSEFRGERLRPRISRCRQWARKKGAKPTAGLNFR